MRSDFLKLFNAGTVDFPHSFFRVLAFVMSRSSCTYNAMLSYAIYNTHTMEMSRLTRGGTAEPVSRDQVLRHARGQGNIHFPCSADHEQDWQPYPVDPYSAICDDHTYILVQF